MKQNPCSQKRTSASPNLNVLQVWMRWTLKESAYCCCRLLSHFLQLALYITPKNNNPLIRYKKKLIHLIHFCRYSAPGDSLLICSGTPYWGDGRVRTRCISERTQASLEAARARGGQGGRPKAIEKIEPRNLACAKAFYAAKQNTIAEIMQMTGFKSRNTFYKYVVNADQSR